MPKVTVFIPVYNGAKFIGSAIKSILNQTYTDFEILIVNDGSTDNTLSKIDQFSDPRIRVYSNPKNLGLTATRNKGLELAKGEYLAINDCDDVSYPNRLEELISILENDKSIGIIGANAKRIFPNKEFKIWSYPKTPDAIKCRLFWGSSIINSSAVFRLSLINKFELKYREGYPPCEDYDFFERAQHFFPLMNLDKVLIDYVEHDDNVTFTMSDNGRMNSNRIGIRQLRNLGIDVNDEIVFIHKILLNYNYNLEEKTLFQVKDHIENIYNQNCIRKVYNEVIFNSQLAEKLFLFSYHSKASNRSCFFNSPLSKYYTPTIKEKIKLVLKDKFKL